MFTYPVLHMHTARSIKAAKGKIDERLRKEDTIESVSECKKFVWVHVCARCLFAWARPFALGGSTGRS